MSKAEKIMELNSSLLNKNNEQFNFQNKDLQSKPVSQIASSLDANKEEVNQVNDVEIKYLFKNVIDAISINYDTNIKLSKGNGDFFVDSNINKNKVDNRFLDTLTSKVKTISDNFQDDKFKDDMTTVSVMVMLGRILLILLKLMESTFKLQDIRRQQTVNNINFVNESINQLLSNAKEILTSSKDQAKSMWYKAMIDGVVGCVTSGVELYITRNIVNSYLSNQKLQMNSYKEHLGNITNLKKESTDIPNDLVPNVLKKVNAKLGDHVRDEGVDHREKLKELCNNHKDNKKAEMVLNDSDLKEISNKENKSKEESLKCARVVAKNVDNIKTNIPNMRSIEKRKNSPQSEKTIDAVINDKKFNEELFVKGGPKNNEAHVIGGLPTNGYIEITQTNNLVYLRDGKKQCTFKRNDDSGKFERIPGHNDIIGGNNDGSLNIVINHPISLQWQELRSMLNDNEIVGTDDNLKEAIKIQFGVSYLNNNPRLPIVQIDENSFLVQRAVKNNEGVIAIGVYLVKDNDLNGKLIFTFDSNQLKLQANNIFDYFKITKENRSEQLKFIEQNEPMIKKLIQFSPESSNTYLKDAYAELLAERSLAKSEAEAFSECYKHLLDIKQIDNIINVLDAEINHQQMKLSLTQAISRGTQSLFSSAISTQFEYSGTNSGNQARFDSSINDYLNNYFQAILKLIRDVNDNENEAIKNYFSTICQTLLSLFELMKKSSTAS